MSRLVIKAFFGSRKWAPWAYGGGLIIIIFMAVQVGFSMILNDIYGKYGDLTGSVAGFKTSAERADGLAEFWILTRRWLFYILGYVLLDAITDLAGRFYAFMWRKSMTHDYIIRLKNVAEKIEGESQRIQEDTMAFAEIIESLGSQAVRTCFMFVGFIPILWNLSKGVNVEIINFIVKHTPLSLSTSVFLIISLVSAHIYAGSSGTKINKPFKILFVIIGIISVHSILMHTVQPLVWLAVYASFGGTVISWFVGIMLPNLEYNNQKVEAALRKELVLGEDDRSRHNSPDVCLKLFADVEFNYRRLFLHYGYFDLWKSWFGMVMAFLPSIIMAPGLFSGLITLGIISQVENAFYKVHGGFGFLMNNWTRITKLRSIWKRLHEFEDNLDKFQTTGYSGKRKDVD